MKENLAGKTWNQLIVNKFSFTAGYSALRDLYRYNDLRNTPHAGFCLIPRYRQHRFRNLVNGINRY